MNDDTIFCDIANVERFIVANVMLQLEMARQNKSCAILYLCGGAGIGKTEIIRQICKKMGWGLNSKHMALMLLEMMTGLPKIQDQTNEAVWSRPELMNFNTLHIEPKDKISLPGKK